MKKEYDLSKLRKREGPVKVYPEAAKVAINIRLDAIAIDAWLSEKTPDTHPYLTLGMHAAFTTRQQ